VPFERIRKILGKERILKWNHEKHPGIVWRFPDPSSDDEKERDPNKIDAFRVKIGERAVALINNAFYEDTPPGTYWLKGEQKKGLEIVFVDQGQMREPWGIPGNVLTKDDQQIGAHGFHLFKVTDPKTFVLSIVSAQRAYTSDQVNDFIRGHVSNILRQHLTNYTVLDGQVLREQEAFTMAMKAKCQEMFSRWGLELISMEVEVYIPEELMESIKKRGEIERYRLIKTIEQQRLEIDKAFDLLKIDIDRVRDLKEYEAKREIELAKRQYDILAKESEQFLKTMDVEIRKLEGEIVRIVTEIQAGRTERIAHAEAIRTELEERAKIAGELLRKTTETELKIKEMDAEFKVKTGLAEVEAWKEVEKARAEAQRRIFEEENRLKTLKEIGEVLSKMAEAVAVGGVEGEAMRKGLEQKFVELLHQIGVDVAEYEKAKRFGWWPTTEIKLEKKVRKEEEKPKQCPSCGRKLAQDAKYCDSCGTKQ
jgi:hypothetical protein